MTINLDSFTSTSHMRYWYNSQQWYNNYAFSSIIFSSPLCNPTNRQDPHISVGQLRCGNSSSEFHHEIGNVQVKFNISAPILLVCGSLLLPTKLLGQAATAIAQLVNLLILSSVSAAQKLAEKLWWESELSHGIVFFINCLNYFW